MLSVTDFGPKGTISEVRVQAGLYLGILDADRSPNAVRFHVGTTQVDFEVDRPPPANSPPGDLLITLVKETVILYKKRVSKMKRVVSLTDLKVRKTRSDCEIACDCVKRANVVLHVGLCKEIFARKHTATHKPTSAQPLIVTTMTHIHTYIHTYTHLSPVEPLGLRPSGATRSLVAWSPAGLL